MIAQDPTAASRTAAVPSRADAATEEERTMEPSARAAEDFGEVVAAATRGPAPIRSSVPRTAAAEAPSNRSEADPAAAMLVAPCAGAQPQALPAPAPPEAGGLAAPTGATAPAPAAAPSLAAGPVVVPPAAQAGRAPGAPAADSRGSRSETEPIVDAARGESGPQPATPRPATLQPPSLQTTVSAQVAVADLGREDDATARLVASDGAAGPGTDPTAPAMLHQGAPRAAGAAAPAAAPPAGDRPLVLDPAAPVSWHLARSAEPAQRDAAPPPPSPTSPHPLVAQIAVAVSRSPERHLEIRLDPPELGRVQIHLTPQDGGVQAVVLADRPETQDLLRRHAEALARELGDAGYGNVTLDFAAGRQATPERRDEGATALALVGTGRIPEATPAPVAAPARATLSGALDIRL